MSWRREGLALKADGQFEWMNSHTGPIAGCKLGDRYRIFFGTRSKKDLKGNYTSRINFADFDVKSPAKLIQLSSSVLLPLGKVGTFDEFGQMPADVVQVHPDLFRLYYMGWQRSINAPYIINIGVAESKDGTGFDKISEGPVFGVNRFNPLGVGNLSVSKQGTGWRMWYTCFNDWRQQGEQFAPTYDIRTCFSDDGLIWTEAGTVCVAPGNEEALATPRVIKLGTLYLMWFSYRQATDFRSGNKGYQTGFAYSHDGITWSRNDGMFGLKGSGSGWDSGMACYPVVFIDDEQGKLIMYYCGDGFGEGGMGVATIEISEVLAALGAKI